VRQSVIISTVSGVRYEDTLAAIRSVYAQSELPHEVILIVDGNRELFERFSRESRIKDYESLLIHFNEIDLGLANSRNIGLELAEGDIISYIDDDAEVGPDWTANVIKAFEDERVDAVTGTVLPNWMFEKPDWFGEELYWMISCSYTGSDRSRGFGTNMSFRASTLERLGGFETRLGLSGKKWLGGEDTEMFLRVARDGGETAYLDNVLVHHKVYPGRLELQNIIKRSYAAGLSMQHLKRLSPGSASSTEESYMLSLVTDTYPGLVMSMLRSLDPVYGKRLLILGASNLSTLAGWLLNFRG